MKTIGIVIAFVLWLHLVSLEIWQIYKAYETDDIKRLILFVGALIVTLGV